MRSPESWSSQIRVHHRYLHDEPRNRAFQAAIEKLVKPGMRVLDLGSGTGIWACVAARAGASKVVAIEFSDMAAHARETVLRNKLENVVEVIHADIRDVDLPRDFDVVIHELVGGLVWEEDMVELCAIAYDKFLKPGGILIPDIVRVYMAPWTLDDRPRPDEWTSVCGVDLGHMYEAELVQWRRLRRAASLDVHGDAIAAPALAHTTHLGVDRVPIPERMRFEFVAERDVIATGVIGFMEIVLDDQIIRTGPNDPPTNWSQFYVPADQPLALRAGERYQVTVLPRMVAENWDLQWRAIRSEPPTR
jgi:SAM-dependent methyltransferase